MKELNLKKITLKNFGPYKDLEFPIKQGRSIIKGISGSGKSFIVESILGCIFESYRMKDPTHNGAGNAKIILEFMVGENTYEVVRNIQSDEKSRPVELITNGEDSGIRRKSDITKEIQGIIPISEDIFRLIVVVTQGLPFNLCRMTPVARKAVIEDLIGFDWKAIKKKISDELKDKRSSHALLESNYSTKRHEMTSLNSKLETLKSVSDQDSDNIQDNLNESKKRVMELLGNLKSEKDQYDGKEKEIGYDRSKALEYVSALNTHIYNFQRKESEYTHILEQRTCPTCHRDYPQDLMDSSSNNLEIIKKKLEMFVGKREVYQSQVNDLNSIYSKISNIESQISTEKNNISYMLKSSKKVDRTGEMEDVSKSLDELFGEVNMLKEQLTGSIEEVEDLTYLNSLLAPSSSFRTIVLIDKVKYLNSLFESIGSFLLPEGVTFKLAVEEESGVCLYITDAGKRVDYYHFSGGERRRIDILVIFVLQKFKRHFSGFSCNFLAFDEIFDGLDKTGVNDVLSCIENIFPEVTSIYVITHNDTIKSMFDNVISVSKEGRVSSVDFQSGFMS